MTKLTVSNIESILDWHATPAPSREGRRVNIQSLVDALAAYPTPFVEPSIVASALGQVAVESAYFTRTREFWGPTVAQKNYEPPSRVATMLGNTQPGDGSRFRGRGLPQLTGRGHARHFTEWVRANFGVGAPDFEKTPEAMEQAPWSGLAFVYYWTAGNPTGDWMNRYAGNDYMISLRINGGLNGLKERYQWTAYFGLMLLGWRDNNLQEFQEAHGLAVDNIAGPQTLGAIHKALNELADMDYTKVEAPAAQNPFYALMERQKVLGPDEVVALRTAWTLSPEGGRGVLQKMLSLLVEGSAS